MDLKKLMNCELFLDGSMKGLEKIKDKKIVDVGIAKGCDIEGGLCIDYLDGEVIKRIVLGFTELGMWVQTDGVKGDCEEADLKQKIENFHNFVSDRDGWKKLETSNGDNGILIFKYKNKKLELSLEDMNIIGKRIPKVKEMYREMEIKEIVTIFWNFINYPLMQVKSDFFDGLNL